MYGGAMRSDCYFGAVRYGFIWVNLWGRFDIAHLGMRYAQTNVVGEMGKMRLKFLHLLYLMHSFLTAVEWILHSVCLRGLYTQ